MLAFTVCHINQLSNACLLGDSLKVQNPHYQYFIGLVDDKDNIPTDFKTPYPIVDIPVISIEGFQEMAQRYTSDELLANCKPFFAQYFIQKSERIIYFDCQTIVHQSISFFSEILDNQSIVLVPQLLYAGIHPDEKQILNTGIYHSGVLALKKSNEVLAFLAWWGSNTRSKGYRDLCRGLNADQLWLEHVPALYENVHILKHDGINIGYWNLPERPIYQLKSEGRLVSENFSGSKFPKEYQAKLAKYNVQSLKGIIPTFGKPNLVEKPFRQSLARNIRSFNNIIDVIIDKFTS